MRERLLHAPAWVLGLLSGSLFGLLWAVWTHVAEDESWTSSLIQGGVMGVFFGAVMGVVQHRQQRGVREVAAHGLVLAQLAQLDRQRRWASAFFLLMAALGVVQAVTENPWWWLAVVAWTAGAVAHPYLRNWLRRRAELLRPDGSVHPA